MKDNFSVVSLFSGAGGMDLGFKNEGFEILWANDFFKEAVDSYKKNIGNHVVYGDITKIPSSEIPDNPDIVIGGFPCQGFSIANTKRSMKDERNFLYKELLRVIKDKNPKFFIAENVKGLLSMEDGKVIKMIVKDFEDLGYKVDYKVLNAAEYGVPQARERVIIIGNRLGLDNVFPEKTHFIKDEIKGLVKAPTVKDTIKDLENIAISEKDVKVNGKIVHNHNAYTNVSSSYMGRSFDIDQKELCVYLKKFKTLRKSSNTKIAIGINEPKTKVDHWFRSDSSGSIPGKEEYEKLKTFLDLDDEFDKVMEYEEKEISFEQSLRITNWDRPSDTITATGPEIHVNKKRRLSVRECARLQTFPEDYIFTGSLDKMYRQVGNAVPVKLAECIASCIKKQLEDYTKKEESK